MVDKRSLFQRLADARTAGENKPPEDPTAMQLYPVVFEFLTRIEADLEHDKDLASLTIRMGVGCWTIDLSDPGFAFSVSAAAPTLESLIMALEATLTGPNPPIKAWRNETGSMRKRKKVDKKTS